MSVKKGTHPAAGEVHSKLIVGLGNPGPKYRSSRHNVGFRCLDALAETHGLAFSALSGKARVASGLIKGHPAVLAKPLTFMNESGRAVRRLMAYYCHGPEHTLVLYDDLDLPLGRIRLRPGGSSGGHKGVQSIIDALGTDEFARLRVGIGRPPAVEEVVDYVLGHFSEDELVTMSRTHDETVSAIEVFLELGIEEAMNQWNRT